MKINNIIRSPRIYGGRVHEALVHKYIRNAVTRKGQKVMDMEIRVNIDDLPECLTSMITYTSFKKPRIIK